MVKKELAATFDVSVRCIEKVIKKGWDYYLKELENGRAKLMSLRARAAKYPELECALLSWIKQCIIDFPHRDLNITRYAVCIKAQLIAKDMKILNFHASRNWFQAFRRRHDLFFGRKHGEKQISLHSKPPVNISPPRTTQANNLTTIPLRGKLNYERKEENRYEKEEENIEETTKMILIPMMISL